MDEMDVKQWEGCTTTEEVLQRLKSVGINMISVTSALANSVLMRDLLATCDGETLLHTAARAGDVSILLAVVQAYKKFAGLLAKALATTDGKRGALPIHIAVSHCNYEHTVLLLKEYKEHSPESLTATVSGETLMHIAASMCDGVMIVKYLLREYRDICEPMLLARNNRRDMPLQVADGTKSSAEFQLTCAESFARTVNAQGRMPQSAQDSTREFHTRRPRQQLEKAKEIISLLSEPTLQAKAAEAERETLLREKQKLQKRELKIADELRALLQDEKWEAIEEYVVSTCEETQKYLASVVGGDSEIPVALPPLTKEVLAVTKKYIGRSEDDPFLKSSLMLLAEFSHQKDSASLLLSDNEGVLLLVLEHLRSLQTDLQHLCVTILFHTAINTEDTSRIQDEWRQPLLLVKNFSIDQDVQRLARETLERLGASGEVPDPGTWSTTDVCFWMNGNTPLERRSEFVKAFRDAEISGLHLLELAPTEMSGLGVKFVSDQRKLSSLIDDLRRLNMRSMVGRKDVFLSYAHINIQFALRIKRTLNDSGYSVWIDTAGIRAGQKWRTEIANGIHDSGVFVFVMTPRSTSSQYCHDELSLAEEYKKPIVTVKYQHSDEMDPGLKLIVQRRQWMDFSDDGQFDSSCGELLEAVGRLIGPGSGPEGQEEQIGHKHTVESSALETASGTPETDEPIITGALSADEIRELVVREVARATAELRSTIQALEARVETLENQH
jgi:hypothetical protein